VQISMRTSSSVEVYISTREWTLAKLPACPLHPSGGCGIARHGSYARAQPPGLRVARWYCPKGHRTFSLLPRFLAARLPGLLVDVEETIFAAARSPSIEAAAASMRDLGISLRSAVRWLRRRLLPVQRAVQTLREADTEMPLVIDTGFLTRLRLTLLLIYRRHWDSGLGVMASKVSESRAANTKWWLTRASRRYILADNTACCRHSYAHAIPPGNATRKHTHHPRHPARVARRPHRQCEHRAAILILDRTFQTLLQRARP